MKLLRNFKLDFFNITIFALVKFLKLRKDLKKCLEYNQFAYCNNIDFSIKKIIYLNLNMIKDAGIKALILDYDGVLSYHDQDKPLPEVLSWLEKALDVFGDGNIFVLSNNPKLERKIYLDERFERKISFIISKPKPDPTGVNDIIHCLHSNMPSKTYPKESILLIDDRLSTGILAAKIVGISSCLILEPYISSVKKFFLIELCFKIIRKFERFVVWHL